MKRASYQNGSVVRKARKLGPDVWVYRYMDAGGVRKAETIGTVAKFPTKAAATKRAAKMRDEINERATCITVSGLCDRYAKDGMPERESTSGPYRSYLRRFREAWGGQRLDVMAKDIMAIEQWLNDYETIATPSKPARPASKKTKLLMKGFVNHLFELAMKWGYLTLQRNPIGLIKIKGKRTRVRPLILITAEQWRGLIEDPKLQPHVRVMIYIAMILGLRASEFLGLRWEDVTVDGQGKPVLRISRSYVDKAVDDTKTPESEQELAIHDDLAAVLKAWRAEQEPVNGWLFGNLTTGRPFWRGQLQKNHLAPAGRRIGIPNFGWHAFRHTYRAMMRELEIPIEMQRTLMRHADIRTTLGYGGKTPAEQGRAANAKVVEMLRRRA